MEIQLSRAQSTITGKHSRTEVLATCASILKADEAELLAGVWNPDTWTALQVTAASGLYLVDDSEKAAKQTPTRPKLQFPQ